MIWIDGRIYRDQNAKISVMDKGLLYGDGVFDTFRIFNGRAFKMTEHLRRLKHSAIMMNITMPRSCREIRAVVKEMYNQIKKNNVFVRIIITRGVGEMGINPKISNPSTIIIMQERPEDKPEPIDVLTSSIIRSDRTFNSKIKSLNYGPNVMAKIEAVRNGKQDAIMCDENGNVTEATTTNIFFVRDGTIHTPSYLCPILSGITRESIMDNFEVEQCELSKTYVYQFDEVFLAGTANGITPIRSIDGFEVRRYKDRPITKKITEWYNKAKLRGEKL